MFSLFDTIPACYGQTDRWTDGRRMTDRIAIASISRVSLLTRDKNQLTQTAYQKSFWNKTRMLLIIRIYTLKQQKNTAVARVNSTFYFFMFCQIFKCYMDGKRIQCWSNALQHVPMYFNHLRVIVRYWWEIATFLYPLVFNAPVGVIPLDYLRDFWWVSCRMSRLQYGAKISPKSLTPLSRVHAAMPWFNSQSRRKKMCHAA